MQLRASACIPLYVQHFQVQGEREQTIVVLVAVALVAVVLEAVVLIGTIIRIGMIVMIMLSY